jgi:hypothetical protein
MKIKIVNIQPFFSVEQLSAISAGCRGEEGDFFVEKVNEIAKRIEFMPQTYQELTQLGAEMDLYFTPCTLAEIKAERAVKKRPTTEITKARVGEVFLDAVKRVDNWSPTTCDMKELQAHIDELEEIEDLIVALGNRVVYLRGVMAARTISETL